MKSHNFSIVIPGDHPLQIKGSKKIGGVWGNHSLRFFTKKP